MINNTGYTGAAAICGVLLAVMIEFNTAAGQALTPVGGSLLAHGSGAVTALILLLGARVFSAYQSNGVKAHKLAWPPIWSFLGGIPGAWVVVLAAMTVPSELGLSGTLLLGLSGQFVFSLCCDWFGWFGLPVRRLTRMDLVSSAMMLCGCGLLLLGEG